MSNVIKAMETPICLINLYTYRGHALNIRNPSVQAILSLKEKPELTQLQFTVAVKTIHSEIFNKI